MIVYNFYMFVINIEILIHFQPIYNQQLEFQTLIENCFIFMIFNTFKPQRKLLMKNIVLNFQELELIFNYCIVSDII